MHWVNTLLTIRTISRKQGAAKFDEIPPLRETRLRLPVGTDAEAICQPLQGPPDKLTAGALRMLVKNLTGKAPSAKISASVILFGEILRGDSVDDQALRARKANIVQVAIERSRT